MSNHSKEKKEKEEQEGGFQDNDFIFYSSGENIYSGGFSIDSLLLKGGKGAIKSLSIDDDAKHGIFGKNLAVPPMWFLSPNKENSKKSIFNDHDEILEEDMHDKLLQLSQLRARKKGTAKLLPKHTKKQTRKRK
uniref:Uncharacterized protein n=1 Tax=viral metagenome TaxID=1070528 RepID=A0A6C0LDK5_9ZZZZ